MRRDTSSDTEASPGVSMSTRSRRRSVGHSTSTKLTSSTARGSRRNCSSSAALRKRSSIGSPLVGRGRHPVEVAVAIRGDDAGALGGVGRGDLLADEGVEQRRLAGLDLAGDGHPQRSVEAAAQVVDSLLPRPNSGAGGVEQLVHLAGEVAAVGASTVPRPLTTHLRSRAGWRPSWRHGSSPGRRMDRRRPTRCSRSAAAIACRSVTSSSPARVR